jgi:putative membrane protein
MVQIALVLALAALLAASLLRAPYPREQWLQHLPTALALAGLAWAARRQWLSTSAMACLTALTALHIFGARWIYSYVPYEQWCDVLFGAGPREWFDWRRNHYDRLVHLAFGLLMPWPIIESAMRHGRLSRRWAFVVALGGVTAISAAYEVLEWLLAIIAAPDFADRYNGQQGDAWDAQKDMALAIAGSLVALAWVIPRSARPAARRAPPS